MSEMKVCAGGGGWRRQGRQRRFVRMCSHRLRLDDALGIGIDRERADSTIHTRYFPRKFSASRFYRYERAPTRGRPSAGSQGFIVGKRVASIASIA